MARGQPAAAAAQQALTNRYSATAAGQGQTALGMADPVLQQMLTKGGYTDVEKADITSGALGAESSVFGAARENAERLAARTRNEAATSATLDDLARQQAIEAGQTTAGLRGKFAQQRISDRDEALARLLQQYGIASGTLGTLQHAATGAATAQTRPGFLGSFLSSLGTRFGGGGGAG